MVVEGGGRGASTAAAARRSWAAGGFGGGSFPAVADAPALASTSIPSSSPSSIPLCSDQLKRGGSLFLFTSSSAPPKAMPSALPLFFGVASGCHSSLPVAVAVALALRRLNGRNSHREDPRNLKGEKREKKREQVEVETKTEGENRVRRRRRKNEGKSARQSLSPSPVDPLDENGSNVAVSLLRR